jgi:hypothetical protein
MLKNESAQNPTKPIPLCPSHLPDSGGIFTLSNKVRMEKISHSVRKVKHTIFFFTDCAVHIVHMYTDMACPYADVEGTYR